MIRETLTCFLLGLLWQPLFSQENIIKSFAETSSSRTICFYPSTLRMLNISGDPLFNEAISGVKKLLIYSLDSSSVADRSYVPVIKEYEKEGFEEYMSMWGGRIGFIYGREGRKPAFVGAYGDSQQAFLFYLSGEFQWDKIPKLMESLEDNSLMSTIINTNSIISEFDE